MEFQQWLDEGRPEGEAPRMDDHRAGCTRCARELRAAVEVERMLAVVVPAAVSEDFNELVFERIRSSSWQRGWRRMLAACAQVMAEPIVPVSLALVIVMTAVANRALLAVDHWPLFGEMTIVRALVVAPLTLGISWCLFRAVQAMLDFVLSWTSVASSGPCSASRGR